MGLSKSKCHQSFLNIFQEILQTENVFENCVSENENCGYIIDFEKIF